MVCSCAMSGGAFAQVNLAGEDATAGGGIEALTTIRVLVGVSRPVYVTYAPGDFTRIFIVEQAGRIRVFNTKTEVLNPTPFLNIDAFVGGGQVGNDERGFLGLAFHPDYQKNGYFYVNYTNNGGATTIARYSVTDDPEVADPGSGVTLLTISQPFVNHNGGWISFGPNDGFLYIATGDGGSACDPFQSDQDITNQLRGKMLRIDVDGDNGPGGNYGIPADNPFVDEVGDDEIWAYGLRNPWRPSFDRATGDLYIADVGQGAWEEINFQPFDSTGEENYGWDCMEGNHCPPGCAPGACACFSPTLTDPIFEYSHGAGFSITGGFVYRGCDIPTLDGTYFFADFVFAVLWSFDFDGNNVNNFTNRTEELAPGGGLFISSISSFGEDARGEIYICDLFGGEVFKIVPVDPTISTADLDCSGEVGVNDLLILLLSWGPCDGCLADLDGDHVVGVSDLLLLLADWS